MIYDLAIVGAGPAGVHTAKWAAKKGLKVILIEKRKDISKVTRYCSEHLILDENYNGDTLRVDTEHGKLISTVNGYEVDYKGGLCPVIDKYYYSPSRRAVHFAWPDRRPFAYKYDKGELLRGLLEECLNLGVTYQNETTAYDGNDSHEGVDIKCVSKGIRSKIRAKKLIIADGVNTRMGQAMGFNRDRGYMGYALCVAHFMSGMREYSPSEWKGFWGRVYGSNLAPLIGTGPAGHFEDWADVIVLGSPTDLPEKVLEYLMKKSPIAYMFENAKVEEKYSCTVKAFTPLKTPYKGNVLLIGDSAAFVEVQAQGALNCGFRAAEAVAKELEGEKGFAEYTDWWLKSFEFNAEGMMRVAQGYAIIPTYEDDEVDYLFSLCEGITLPGTWSQYNSPKYMWDTILRDPERIMQERPALFEKIKKARAATLGDAISVKGTTS